MGIENLVPPVTLAALQSRLLDRIRQRIQNGELTERGLARLCGISQPHMHHVLKGVRTLSVELADEVMSRLRISLLDLLKPEELAVPGQRKQPQRELETFGVRPTATPAKTSA